jgi:hypothetical protein
MRETDKDTVEDRKIEIKTEQLINHKTPLKVENENDPQTLGWKGWKRVSGVDQIRRIVEHLGDSQQEQELRNNLVTSLLADRRVTDIPGRWSEGEEGMHLDPILRTTSFPPLTSPTHLSISHQYPLPQLLPHPMKTLDPTRETEQQKTERRLQRMVRGPHSPQLLIIYQVQTGMSTDRNI